MRQRGGTYSLCDVGIDRDGRLVRGGGIGGQRVMRQTDGDSIST